jgi:hypothetical protein
MLRSPVAIFTGVLFDTPVGKFDILRDYLFWIKDVENSFSTYSHLSEYYDCFQ